ncbi:hypothetical protein KIPB_016364, partial [Kipferlia bialata]
ENWSCEFGDMLECPHDFIFSTSYFGCYIDVSLWPHLPTLTFTIEAFLLSAVCVGCFCASMLKMRQRLNNGNKKVGADVYLYSYIS